MEEIWKIVENSNNKYEVSNLGNVRSSKTLKKLKPLINKGYKVVGIIENNQRKTRTIHRLVAKAFIPNPQNKREVNHIDGNKNNNCIDNLEWVTPKENMAHSRLTGLNKGHPKTKPSKARKVLCLETNQIYKSAGVISKLLGVNRCAVSHQIARQGKCKGFTFVYII